MTKKKKVYLRKLYSYFLFCLTVTLHCLNKGTKNKNNNNFLSEEILADFFFMKKEEKFINQNT